MDFQLALGRGVAAERTRAGMSQGVLAEALGIPRSSVSDIENGSRRVAVVELLAICKALKAPASRLLASAEPEDLDALGF